MFDDFVLFKGVEVGICEDGSLDVFDVLFGWFDFVVGVICDGFDLLCGV